MRGKHFCRQEKKKLSTLYKILGCASIITFVVLLLVIQGISFSSYKKTAIGSDSARVAKPVLTFSNSDYAKWVVAGEEADIDFTVSNDDQENTSETALQYTIKVEKLSSAEGKIDYILYECSDSEASLLTEVARATDELTYSPTKQLPAGTLEKHYFQLHYTPALEKNDGAPLFKISVDAEQVI